jgi:hypothetical protein
MSKEELEKWKNKLELFLSLHGGISYWDHPEISFCETYKCPYRDDCSPTIDDIRQRFHLCIEDGQEGHLGKLEYRKRNWETDRCADWIKNV